MNLPSDVRPADVMLALPLSVTGVGCYPILPCLGMCPAVLSCPVGAGLLTVLFRVSVFVMLRDTALSLDLAAAQ